jgi:hypothetical protein
MPPWINPPRVRQALVTFASCLAIVAKPYMLGIATLMSG